MRALLVYATGKIEWREDAAPADEWHVDGAVFELAPRMATDENTRYDGVQLRIANGPPNDGTIVYIQRAFKGR